MGIAQAQSSHQGSGGAPWPTVGIVGDDDWVQAPAAAAHSPSQPLLELVTYDARWPDHFIRTRHDLASVLPDTPIEHIGSTSVPGLVSKDTIEVLVGVDDVTVTLTPDLLGRLFDLGFDHRPGSFAEDPDHAFLRRRRHGLPTDHVHVMRVGSSAHTARLLFRDHLRAEPEVAAAYARAKTSLLARHEGRRYDYVDAKVAVVDALMEGAQEWAARTGWHPRA